MAGEPRRSGPAGRPLAVTAPQRRPVYEAAVASCRELGGYWTGSSCRARNIAQPLACPRNWVWSSSVGECIWAGGRCPPWEAGPNGACRTDLACRGGSVAVSDTGYAVCNCPYGMVTWGNYPNLACMPSIATIAPVFVPGAVGIYIGGRGRAPVGQLFGNRQFGQGITITFGGGNSGGGNSGGGNAGGGTRPGGPPNNNPPVIGSGGNLSGGPPGGGNPGGGNPRAAATPGGRGGGNTAGGGSNGCPPGATGTPPNCIQDKVVRQQDPTGTGATGSPGQDGHDESEHRSGDDHDHKSKHRLGDDHDQEFEEQLGDVEDDRPEDRQ